MQPPGPGPNDPDAETRRISDGGADSRQPDPGTPAGQPGHTVPENYPPTAGYPQAGGYPSSGGYPQSGDYPSGSSYPPGSYPPGSYPPGSYPQGGYDQGGYGQGGYGGYPQGGYPGYPQGGYGGYPPPGNGGGQPPSHRQRNIIIITVAAVLLAAGIPLAIVLATSGGNGPGPGPGALTPTATPATPPAPTPTPTRPSPTPTSSGGFTAGQQDLLGQLDRSVVVDCEPNEKGEGGAIDSSVICKTDDNRYVAAYHFVDGAALATDTRNRARGVDEEGDCDKGQSGVHEWNHNGVTQGTLLCYFGDDKDFVMYWTYDNDLLSFLAFDPDATALYQWWRNFNPVR